MAKEQKKSKPKQPDITERPRVMALLMAVALFALSLVVTLSTTLQRRYDLGIGSYCQQTIVAPSSVVDETVTENLRRAARERTAPVYRLDAERAEELLKGAEECFTAIQTLRAEAAEIRKESGISASGGEIKVDNRSWQVVVPQNVLMDMLEELLPIAIQEPVYGYALLSAQDTDITRLQDTLLPKLTEDLQAGLDQKDVSSACSAAVRELKRGTLSSSMKAVGEMIYQKYYQATYTLDEDATALQREAAANAVEPVMMPKGAVIVANGDTVTKEQYATLLRLDLIAGRTSDVPLVLGTALCLACAWGMFYLYLLRRRMELVNDRKSLSLLGGSAAAALVLGRMAALLDPRLNAAIFAVLLVGSVLSVEAAAALNPVLCLVVLLCAGGKRTGILSQDALFAFATALAGGYAGLLSFKKGTRSSLSVIGAGLAAMVASALVSVGLDLVAGNGGYTLALRMCIGAAPAVVLAVLVTSIKSLLESTMDVPGVATLELLASGDHPLLRKLKKEARGTYDHSLTVAELCGVASDAIAANGYLARAAAMFHDVGKLRRPLYFAENQEDYNIHDDLKPLDSARYIIAHVQDGEQLMRRAKVPEGIIRMVMEHHGDGCAAYFYRRAVKEYERALQLKHRTAPVEEADYRYGGPVPSTKESAILMLAESCEAAVASLEEPSMEAIRELLERIFDGKLRDGQLDHCPVTMQELTVVRNSFLKVFVNMYVKGIRQEDPMEEEE